MPRRKRETKRRESLTPQERLEAAFADLPPNPLIREGGIDDDPDHDPVLELSANPLVREHDSDDQADEEPTT